MRIDSFIYYVARILKKMRLSAIRDSQIHQSSVVESGSQVVNSVMEKHSYCGYDCVILNTSIGSFCSISDRVVIGGSEHPMHFLSTSPVFLSHRDSVKMKFARHEYVNKPYTQIGHDVWIGNGAKIKAGVTIGSGAVIGMGSVVTKDIPPYSIFAGNPAIEVRKRFSDTLIERLEKSEWWGLPEDKLIELGKYADDPIHFLAELEQR